MPIRSLRRLAGCIAIELLLAVLWAAGAPDKSWYKAGTASAGQAKALVLEDRRGGRAIFADADFKVSRAVSDVVGAQLLKAYDLDRASLLLRGKRDGEAQPEDLVTAISAALGALEPASVQYGGGILSVRAPDGHCRGAFSANAALVFDHCAEGALVRGAVRAAFQMVEGEHGLLQRSDAPPVWPVQAIALGKDVVVVGLGGESVLPPEFAAKTVLFAPWSNDSETAPADDVRMREAIRRVLRRVGR